MRFHVGIIAMTICAAFALNQDENSRLLHHLKKRNTAEDYGPVPLTAHEQYAPLPYQQGQADSGSAARGAAVNSGQSGARDNRRDFGTSFSSSVLHSDPVDDWVASSDLGHTSYSAQAQTFNNPQEGGSHLSSSSSSSSSSSDRDRSYYQYQPPVSRGRRQPSGSQYQQGSRQTQYHVSTRHVPTQTHVAGSTRYTYTQPVASGTSTSTRRQSGRTYTYPFSGGRDTARSHVQVLGSLARGSGSGSQAGSVSGGSVGSSSQGGGSQSVTGDEEPLVQVFPSEAPVVTPTLSPRQQVLRQRELERQRRLEQLRQQQSAAGNPRRGSSPSSSSSSSSSTSTQQRQVYTGSQQLGSSYGGPGVFSGRQTHTRQTQGGQHQVQTGYSTRHRPIYTYSQTGASSTGQSSRYDSQCPNTGIRIQINGIPCEQAVDTYGRFLCYRHEYTSRECCIKCRGLKNPTRVGCEYGDHSSRCQQLQPYDCYDLRNRQACCETCQRYRVQGAASGCEYNDMTPNCDRVRQNPGLCYIPENRYLCCHTCSTLRATADPQCPWGDHNSELCQLFDSAGNIRINCYAPPIQRICCQACRRLQEWIPMDQPGCEYGDRPATFNTGTHRNLNCTSFMRHYGYEQCTLNQAVAENCCYTCHRYTQG